MTLKNKLKDYFFENEGVLLSGQHLADYFDVSRTAIWKSLKTLQEEGVPIRAIPQVGYILDQAPDVIHAASIQSKVNFPLEVIYEPIVDSTNNVAKRILEKKPTRPHLVLADEQSAGKGRLGRTFVSPMKMGLYMSLAIPNLKEDVKPTLLTTMAAVASCQAVEELCGISLSIKWVNDLYYRSKKVCGILTEGVINFETQTIDSIVIGIGINLQTDESTIPPELRQKIGGIFDGSEEPIPFTRNDLAAAVTRKFFELYDKGDDRSYMNEYRARCFILGSTVSFTQKNQRIDGVATTIDDDGALYIKEENGTTHKIAYGEISIEWQ